MNRAFVIGGVFLLVGASVGASIYAGGQTSVTPLHVEAPRYDIYAPPACEKMLQEEFPHAKSDVSVPSGTFLAIQQKLAACGGKMVLEK